MSTNIPPTPQPEPPPIVDPGTPAPPAVIGAIPKERFDEVNEKKKAAEAKLAEFEANAKIAEEKRLESEKKYEDLAVKRATERDAEKARADAAEARLQDIEARLHAVADARVKELPEKLRALVPNAESLSATDRIAKIEELLSVVREINPAPAPGNGPGPRPAGSPVDTAGQEAARKSQSRIARGF